MPINWELVHLYVCVSGVRNVSFSENFAYVPNEGFLMVLILLITLIYLNYIKTLVSFFFRYFIGTCESTFSFRIHEERDILGFPEKATFNCICGKQSPPDKCHPPSKWRVKFSWSSFKIIKTNFLGNILLLFSGNSFRRFCIVEFAFLVITFPRVLFFFLSEWFW